MPQAKSITVTVRFLARYAEVVGRDMVSVTATVPATVDSILAQLGADVPSARALPPKPLCARNFRQVRGNEPLLDGDELALLPPLAGG
ncbi:MAG TPA: MoaD/ThiS family protein [Gemmatimonadales bacterium]|nr:MoaD/ThiS family protein [Gemmatimonadales bacterium]